MCVETQCVDPSSCYASLQYANSHSTVVENNVKLWRGWDGVDEFVPKFSDFGEVNFKYI